MHTYLGAVRKYIGTVRSTHPCLDALNGKTWNYHVLPGLTSQSSLNCGNGETSTSVCKIRERSPRIEGTNADLASLFGFCSCPARVPPLSKETGWRGILRNSVSFWGSSHIISVFWTVDQRHSVIGAGAWRGIQPTTTSVITHPCHSSEDRLDPLRDASVPVGGLPVSLVRGLIL